MAYIATETVKEMRKKLKAKFPSRDGWRLSVTTQDYSSVCVTILQAPVRFTEKDYEQLNPYHLNTYENSEILEEIKTIINKDNYDNSNSQEDYYDVGHYVNIHVGKWDKPFQLAA